MKSISCGLSFLLCFQFFPTPALAQGPASLNLIVLEGEGATNSAHQRLAHEPVVRVVDEKESPVVGAAVVFTLPTEGATGAFSNGSKTLTVMTDNEGRAAGKGLHINQVSGKLPIHVTASYRGLGARTIITEVNEGVPGAKASTGGGSGKWVAILLLAGAAAGGGAYYYSAHNNSSSPGSPAGPSTPTAASIGLTPGTGIILGPH